LTAKRFMARTLGAAILILAPSATGWSGGQNPAAPSTPADLNDQGTFTISLAGRPLGKEKFKIKSSPDKIAAEAEIEMRVEQGPQTVNLKTNPQLVLTPQLEPQTYTVIQKGSPAFHLEVDFHVSPAKSVLRLAASKEDDVRDFTLTKDVVILDDNVIHHYQLLVDRFVMKPDNPQTFSAYTPQEALPGTISVQDVGTEGVEFAGRKETLRHLVVTSELTRIDLWVDAQQHLQRLVMSAVQLEAVRTN
jgi:hypothetical protein